MRINLQHTFRGFAAICGATLAVGGAAAISNTASADSTATPWTYQGLFDGYFNYDGNSPKGGSSTGYEYDERTSTPTLSLAELNIAKAAPASGGLAFKTTLIAGDTATLNADQGNPPGSGQETRYQNVQQLYISYVTKSGAGADLGKFYTPFGYEVTESNGNYNYSRSFIFTDLLPVYHAGLRIYSPSYKGLTATGYIVKTLQNYVDDGEGVYSPSKSLAFIGSLNYTAPSGKFVVIETYGGGSDGSPGSEDKALISDTDLTVTPEAVDTFGLEYTNKQDVINSEPGEQYNGYAGYYRRQLTTPYAVAFRLEKDFQKASFISAHVDSITATFEDKVTKSLLARLEFRHDDVSDADSTFGGFPGGNPGGEKTQNTLSLSGVWTFGP